MQPTSEQIPLNTPQSNSITQRPRSRVRGFTLLEVILALALSVFIVGAISSAIQLYLVTLTRQQKEIEQKQIVRSVIMMINNDLRSAIQYKTEDYSGLENLKVSLDLISGIAGNAGLGTGGTGTGGTGDTGTGDAGTGDGGTGTGGHRRRPEVRAPEVRVPEVRAPEVRAPEVRAPEVRAPEALELDRLGADWGLRAAQAAKVQRRRKTRQPIGRR